MTKILFHIIMGLVVFIGGIFSAVATAVLTDIAMNKYRKVPVIHHKDVIMFNESGDVAEFHYDTAWYEFRPVSNPNILCIALKQGSMQCFKD